MPAALIDVEIWSGNPRAALSRAKAALSVSPRERSLLLGEAKAFELLNRPKEALAALDTIDRVAPNYEGAATLRRRLRPR